VKCNKDNRNIVNQFFLSKKIFSYPTIIYHVWPKSKSKKILCMKRKFEKYHQCISTHYKGKTMSCTRPFILKARPFTIHIQCIQNFFAQNTIFSFMFNQERTYKLKILFIFVKAYKSRLALLCPSSFSSIGQNLVINTYLFFKGLKRCFSST